MYRYLRNTHLVLGLSLVLFVLVYGVSAVEMAHHSWFATQPKVSESRVAVGPGVDDSPRALARELMDRYGLRGELREVRQASDGCELQIARPGTEYEVKYSRAEGQATIRTEKATFIGMLGALHHIAGFWRGYSVAKVWAVFVAMVSAGLILMALTGIYLWFKIASERVVGAVLLAISLGYSLTLIVLLRVA